jgi:predicted RNase H-like nuclease (RuvC/YqgF family)
MYNNLKNKGNMIEKKIMGYVDFRYPHIEAKAVPVIVNNETGKVELFREYEEEPDWSEPSENEHFYPTVESANEALERHKRNLYDSMEEVRNYVRTMNNWLEGKEEDDEYTFEEEDYLPPQNRCNTSDSYWNEKFEREAKLNKYLVEALHTAFVNISGDSFRMKDVDHVRWGEKNTEIILTTGRTIKTSSEVELEVVKILFGRNYSNIKYTDL